MMIIIKFIGMGEKYMKLILVGFEICLIIIILIIWRD